MNARAMIAIFFAFFSVSVSAETFDLITGNGIPVQIVKYSEGAHITIKMPFGFEREGISASEELQMEVIKIKYGEKAVPGFEATICCFNPTENNMDVIGVLTWALVDNEEITLEEIDAYIELRQKQ